MSSIASLAKQGGRVYGQSRSALRAAAPLGRIGQGGALPPPPAPVPNQPFNRLPINDLIGIARVRRHEEEEL